MTALGEFALWIALPISLWGMVLGFAGGKNQRGDLALSAEKSVYAVFFLLVLASAGIVDAFVGDRFEYLYVANYSNRELDIFFKISGLWAGQRGSLLFWAVLLALFSSIAVFQNRDKNREFMPYVVGVLQVILVFFLVVLLFADVNPFERLPFLPADGQGLNPQLQNYWMVIHPPTLYLGFTAFSIPFAFA
ncbi:MAG: cytochrome c biogenesis protein CcsA, partial [Gemmatimonadetes bacterium]|nr:cytochrome c biogenesis protein CcsA [Gemmatimonadota bacterium]